MGARSILLAATVLGLCGAGLSGCASSQYGYAYCYDPYRGPIGYYTGPFEKAPACAANTGVAAQAAYYAGPYENGYRGPYVSGPHAAVPPAPPAGAVR
ncbi:MAG: hypothetical protein AB1942_01415 [Pseudomonadota bacterium]